jgi:hypothetical protein
MNALTAVICEPAVIGSSEYDNKHKYRPALILPMAIFPLLNATFEAVDGILNLIIVEGNPVLLDIYIIYYKKIITIIFKNL